MANETNWYTTVFKSWQVKLLGPKPSAEMLATVHGLGARPGKQALASAMGLRDCGVTNAQIVMACGAPQLNKMRGFITDALLKREPAPPSPEGHTVYKLVLTAKGKQRVERTAKAAAEKAAEGGETAKAKPAKKQAAKTKRNAADKPAAEKQVDTAVTETPTSDAPSVTEQAPVEQANA